MRRPRIRYVVELLDGTPYRVAWIVGQSLEHAEFIEVIW